MYYLNTIIFIILFFQISLSAQSDTSSFSGSWLRSDPNTVLLEFKEISIDTVEFTMTRYNENYYGYLGGGEYSNPKYAVINNTTAYFNDSAAISDGRPLYYEGEEPCELFFNLIDGDTIEVHEQNCRMIYGGVGVTWEGVYVKTRKKYDNQ